VSDVRVTVLYGAGVASAPFAALSTERSLLEQLLDDTDGHVELHVVSSGLAEAPLPAAVHVDVGDDAPGPFDRLLTGLGARTLRARLARFPLGRLLNSMGPLDPGRMFWRAVRRSPAALAAIRSSDIVYAADLASVKTAWIAVRRGWVREGRYDHRASALGR
jgi:hypothetical protein